MSQKVTCPHCQNAFAVEKALSAQIEQYFRQKYTEKVHKETENLKKEQEKLQKLQNNQKEILKRELLKQLEAEKEKMKMKVAENELKMQKEAEKRVENRLKVLLEENEKQKKENYALKAQELELLRRENALKQEKEALAMQMQKEMLVKEGEIAAQAEKKAREKALLERAELEKQLSDQKKLIEEMKRKSEQGSQQLQGEVQELALEKALREAFPFDTVAEVGKGVRGADCLLSVYNSFQQFCGTVVFECKRTKRFSDKWVEKLKDDQLAAKAEVAVLVTDVMPAEMRHFGQIRGVWVCTFAEVVSLARLLRVMLMKTHQVLQAQENKGDKMALLYKYLTSTEFLEGVKRLGDTYGAMQAQLTQEKRAMKKIWAAREKQIMSIETNMAHIFGSIKGISGQKVSALEEVVLEAEKSVETEKETPDLLF